MRATALWLVATLLLRAAMAWLAAGAAHAQGLALVEVCTVYGVATVTADRGELPHPGASAHDGADCGLAHLLPPLPGSDMPAPMVARPAATRTAAGAQARAARDRCAAWLAAVGHAPPARG